MYFVCVFESDGVRSSARNKYIVFFLFRLKAGKINSNRTVNVTVCAYILEYILWGIFWGNPLKQTEKMESPQEA